MTLNTFENGKLSNEVNLRASVCVFTFSHKPVKNSWLAGSTLSSFKGSDQSQMTPRTLFSDVISAKPCSGAK